MSAGRDRLQARVAQLPGDQTALLQCADPEVLLRDLDSVDESYPGGLSAYLRTARGLLSASQSGAVTVSEVRPGPLVTAPTAGSPEYDAFERHAVADLLPATAFVLVAGGLGERLGFSGLKVSLPLETISGTPYLQHFAEWIKLVAGSAAPFVLMTSDDTHSRTEELLKTNAYFGLTNVTLLKQELVPCLADSDGSLAFDRHASRLLRKPHGHGDVHHLLLSSGTLDRWFAQGVKHVVFFQDTNAAVTVTVPQSLSIVDEGSIDMAFTCVPKEEGAAVGSLASAVGPDGLRRVQNIEYNVFSPAFEASAKMNPEGVQRPEDYGASINTLVLRFEAYHRAVTRTGGVVPEFINPKYTDSSRRTSFKSPSRVESLMQDIALTLPPESKVVGVLFPADLYSPVKNKLIDGAQAAARGVPAHCPATGEEAVLAARVVLLRTVGVVVSKATAEEGVVEVAEGLRVSLLPAVSFDNTFGGTLSQLRTRFPSPSKVRISARSVLWVEGAVTIESLDLDGALVVVAPPGTSCTIRDAKIVNRGMRPLRLTPEEAAPPLTAIRGFKWEVLEVERRSPSKQSNI